MNNWNRIWKPIVVLSLICVIVTGALAATKLLKKIAGEPIASEVVPWTLKVKASSQTLL